MKDWTVYFVRCKDNTLYTGITTDLKKRIAAHNAGKGAKYTRGRGPVEVVWFEGGMTQGEALCKEAEIKKLSRAQKEALIN
jgi:putative endonuclease